MGSELSKRPGFGWTTPPARKVVITDVIAWNKDTKFDVIDVLNNANARGGGGGDASMSARNEGEEDLFLNASDAALFLSQSEQVLKDHLSTYELNELYTQNTSGNLPLKFTIMKIQPNVQFSLHAHPNIEFIFVKSGTMHEYRYIPSNPEDPPLKEYKDGKDITGPDMSHLPISKCTFEYRCVSAKSLSRFLVNESGSVHLSFTRDDGAELVVLWSGNHAKIEGDKMPANIQEIKQKAV